MKVTYRDFDGAYDVPSYGIISNVRKVEICENFVNVLTENGKICRIKFEKLVSIESEDGEQNEGSDAEYWCQMFHASANKGW